MNDAAYDISYLLELDATSPAMPELRSPRPEGIKPEASEVGAAQQALASELLQMEGHHEELIRQYMSVMGDAELGADW
jgi:hypothetical protein